MALKNYLFFTVVDLRFRHFGQSLLPRYFRFDTADSTRTRTRTKQVTRTRT